MKNEQSRVEYDKAERIGGQVLEGYEKGPPCCTLVWCSPCCAKCCSCCSCFFSKCSQCSACSPCCYFIFPCCCCCCRPPVKQKPPPRPCISFESTVAESLHSENELNVEKKKEKTPSIAPSTAAPSAAKSTPAKDPSVAKKEVRRPKQTEKEEEISSSKPPEVTKTKVVKAKKEAVRPKPAAAMKPKAFADSVSAAPVNPEEAQGPPPLPPSTSKKTGAGIYLIYTEEAGGSLKHKFSTSVVEGPGVLAYIKSSVEIPAFRLKKEGISVVAKDLVKNFLSSYPQDRIPYYTQWVKFLHLSVDFKGDIILLPGSSVHPPPQVSVIFLKERKVTFAKVDISYSYKDIDTLAVVPTASAPKFKIDDIDFAVFSLIANTDGSFTSFLKK